MIKILYIHIVLLAFTIGFVKNAHSVNESYGVVPLMVVLYAGELTGEKFIIVHLTLIDGSAYVRKKKSLIFCI